MSTDRRTLIMRNLRDTLRATPGIKGAVDEAPREDELRTAATIKRPLPFAWVFERESEEPVSRSTGLLFEALPVTVELVYEFTPSHDTEDCRAKGRRLLADIQTAIAADLQRGRDEENNAPYAIDTEEVGNAIVPLPQKNLAVVGVDYRVTFYRAIKDPRSIRAVAA